MKKIETLIIEDNQEIIYLLKKHFSDTDIVIKDVANDGELGLNLINQNNYDVVILDLVMPKRDGLYVLENIKNKNIYKKIIISTSNNSSYLINKISSFGVAHYLLKPYDLETLEKRILEISKENVHNTNIAAILKDFGIPMHLKGYEYLEKLINEIYRNPRLCISDVYSLIAKQKETTSTSIERTIRYAIEVGFNRADVQVIEKHFGSSINKVKGKPTNMEFLWTVMKILK